MGEVIESSNFMWALASLLGAFYTYKWRKGGALSPENSEIVHAWTWIFSAAGLNHGWFAMSRHLGGGDTWNDYMFEWRWLLVLVTSVMFCYGMVKFIKLIENFSVSRKISWIGVIAIASYTLGFLF